jgi:hypothetical protein
MFINNNSLYIYSREFCVELTKYLLLINQNHLVFNANTNGNQSNTNLKMKLSKEVV